MKCKDLKLLFKPKMRKSPNNFKKKTRLVKHMPKKRKD